METKYRVHELPNLTDPDLIRCCVAAQEMRRTVSHFIQHILPQLQTNGVTIPIRVAMAIMQRLAEGALSIEILCMKNRVRDAAIVLLSLIELRLDLQYIAIDTSRADTWIDHSLQNKKPWKVRSQLEEIYPDEAEREAEISVYRQYSMVKHCNPAALSFGFRLAVTRDTLQVDLASENHQSVRIHLFGLGCCIHRTGEAASRIWSAQGLDVGLFMNELKAGSDSLSRCVEDHIISLLQATNRSASES